MIGQRVNFFQPRFRPHRPFWSLRKALFSWLGLLLALWAGHWGLQADLANRRAEWAGQTETTGRMSEASTDWAALRQCRTDWEPVAATEFASPARAMAPLLEQFALLHRPGIWLTRIELSQGGQRVSIQGHTTARLAEQLPAYVQALAHLPILAGREVRDLQWAKSAPAAPHEGRSPTEPKEPTVSFHLLME